MLSAIVDRHVALHHATGYLFKKQSCLLHGFAKYAEAKGDEVVRAITALEWAALGPTAATRQGRLDVVCRFARLVRAEDQRHEVPPAYSEVVLGDVLPSSFRRRTSARSSMPRLPSDHAVRFAPRPM